MEDTIRYQCHVVHDLALDREFTGFRRIVHLRLIILRVLICLLLGYYTSVFTTGWYLFIFALFFIAVEIYNFVSLLSGKRFYKRIQVSNQGKPYDHIISFKDGEICIEESSSGNVKNFSYDHLRYVNETKNLLILILTTGICILVDKRTLTGGSKEDFVAFLKERCPKFKGNASKCTVRKIITAIYAALLIVVLFVGLFRIPQVIDLTDRLSGRIPYTATCAEIVQELEDLDITGFDAFLIEDCESYYSEYPSYFNNRDYKLPDLLEAVGTGYFHEDSIVWHPSDSGVFYYDTDLEYPHKPYSYLVKGIATLDPALNFRSVQEVKGDQMITVSFSWEGKQYSLTAPNRDGVFSTDVLRQLNTIIKEQSAGKQLYYAFDYEGGILLFYRDAQWAERFQHKTGMVLYD